jgi:hypothetical protein
MRIDTLIGGASVRNFLFERSHGCDAVFLQNIYDSALAEFNSLFYGCIFISHRPDLVVLLETAK